MITELVVRVYGIPEHAAAARVSFPDVAGAADTAIAIVQSGIPIARCELLDAAADGRREPLLGPRRAGEPTLFLEFHGSEAGVQEQVAHVRGDRRASSAAARSGGRSKAEDRSRLWKARHDVYFSLLAYRPGCRR